MNGYSDSLWDSSRFFKLNTSVYRRLFVISRTPVIYRITFEKRPKLNKLIEKRAEILYNKLLKMQMKFQ